MSLHKFIEKEIKQTFVNRIFLDIETEILDVILLFLINLLMYNIQ